MSQSAAVSVDQVELELFVARDQARVEAVVSGVTGDSSRASDAVQDALVSCLAAPPAEPVRNLAGWLTMAAINRARDRARSASAERRAWGRLGPPSTLTFEEMELVDTDVRRALQSLSVQQRRVCTLHYLLDLSVDQVAAALDVTPGTVKTLLHRARRALAAELSAPAH